MPAVTQRPGSTRDGAHLEIWTGQPWEPLLPAAS